MKQQIIKIFTLDEQEIKAAIRKHFIDLLGTAIHCNEKNIELNAQVDESYQPHEFSATISINE